MQEYEPLYFDEYVHISTAFKYTADRQRFLKEIRLDFSVDLLHFDPGSGVGATFWKVPEDRSPVEMMTSATKMFKSLENRIPEYHTRFMRQSLSKRYSTLCDIPKHIFRSIYAELAPDASSDQSPSMDNRVRQALFSNDPEMITDLRHLNKGRPNDTFNVFYEQLEKVVDEMTATDERRHNVAHFSKFISIPDLINQVTNKCLESTPIPSESSVLFAFVPKNSHTRTAKLYKGRINLQHKVQTRQLRVLHIDEHYCAAVFKYMKGYAVKYHGMAVMVCLDDKSKVDFGEPGLAISSGVRGKKSIVATGSILSALDHDVQQKGSLTPSVCLLVDIPEKVEDTFYKGQVFVTLKDSIFQPRSPWRHATELIEILKKGNTNDGILAVPPILLIYSDGGPDHRLTFESVKLSCSSTLILMYWLQLEQHLVIVGLTLQNES